jgi:citrate synthase
MGVGHRVYATIDPRAVIMKRVCAEVLAAVGKPDDDLLAIAAEVEEKISKDESVWGFWRGDLLGYLKFDLHQLASPPPH